MRVELGAEHIRRFFVRILANGWEPSIVSDLSEGTRSWCVDHEVHCSPNVAIYYAGVLQEVRESRAA